MASKLFISAVQIHRSGRFIISRSSTRIYSPFTRTIHKDAADKNAINKIQNSEKKKLGFLQKYVYFFIKNYDHILEKRFPRAIGIYRLFQLGIAGFLKDLKYYMKLRRILRRSDYNFQVLTRKELELYQRMPGDIAKLGPTIFIAALPFVCYAYLPLLYYFPRELLTKHFWNLEQRSGFTILDLKDRLTHNRPVFRHLQAHLQSLEEKELYEPWKNILGLLGSGAQPTTDQILCCKNMFVEDPYNLEKLSRNHIKHLSKMHGMRRFGYWRKRTGLRKQGILILEIDKAIIREGGVHNLNTEDLRNACVLRGLNPSNMPNEDLIKWLEKWIVISKAVNNDNISLILHCSILLAYNEQNNWTLIYGGKK